LTTITAMLLDDGTIVTGTAPEAINPSVQPTAMQG